MEYPLSKKTLSVNETVFEGCAEQPIDLDYSLPDYCPDMQKNIKMPGLPQNFHQKHIR